MNNSNEPQSTPTHLRRWRSIGAVLAGMLVVVILSIGTDMVLRASGIYPPSDARMSDGLYVLATAYRILYTVAGGFVAARLAPQRPMRHALVFGGVGLLLSIAGTVATRNWSAEFGPRWYPIAIIVIAMPCAWAGGTLRVTQLRGRTRSGDGPRE